jgi:hypothetical protein
MASAKGKRKPVTSGMTNSFANLRRVKMPP